MGLKNPIVQCFAKTQGILYAGCKFPDSKIKDIVIFAVKFFILFLETECICQVSFAYEPVTHNSHNLRNEKV